MTRKLSFLIVLIIIFSQLKAFGGDFTITDITDFLTKSKEQIDATLAEKGFTFKGIEETAYGDNYIWEGTMNNVKYNIFAIKMSPSDSSFVSVGVNYIANDQELISYQNKLENGWQKLQYSSEDGRIEAYYSKDSDIISIMQWLDGEGNIHFVLSSLTSEFYSMSFPD